MLPRGLWKPDKHSSDFSRLSDVIDGREARPLRQLDAFINIVWGATSRSDGTGRASLPDVIGRASVKPPHHRGRVGSARRVMSHARERYKRNALSRRAETLPNPVSPAGTSDCADLRLDKLARLARPRTPQGSWPVHMAALPLPCAAP